AAAPDPPDRRRSRSRGGFRRRPRRSVRPWLDPTVASRVALVSGDADLAEFARRALERPDAISVMGDAVALVARALDVEHVTILELGPSDGDLRLRAGVGWGDGVAGTKVDAMPGGHVAYTLASAEPVLVTDLASETRFAPSPQLVSAGVHSSLS